MNMIKRLFSRAVPFLTIGILIAVAIALLVMIVHIVLWGMLIGVVLYAFSAITHCFKGKRRNKPQAPSGRIIDHDPS